MTDLAGVFIPFRRWYTPDLSMDTAHRLRERLADLARNLHWAWHEEVQAIFRDLDPDLWRSVNHNPVAFLRQIEDVTLAARARALALEARILGAARRLEEYLQDRDTWCTRYAGMLTAHPVAYFSAEFGLHESLPLYSGGLGVLAGDHLKSASDLGVPIWGVGLFYALGYFTQRLDVHGWQREEFGQADIHSLPLEIVKGADGAPLRITIPCGGTEVGAVVWLANVGRNRLLLLDTDVEGNDAEWRAVTHRLYWGDQTSRIRQEVVLGIGGYRALRAVGVRPGVLHLNEGHSAFALLEAVRSEMEENDATFEQARHRIASRTVFTTHTPVPAGHDRFSAALIEAHLGGLRGELGLEPQEFLALGRTRPDDEGETFCMTVLALRLASRRNAVSSIHGDVSRRMWQGVWPERDPGEIPIGHVTNGVHTRSWIAPQMLAILERHLGPDWAQRISRGDLWFQVERVSPVEIWETHQVLKSELIDFVRARFVEQEVRRGADAAEVRSRADGLLDPGVLLLGFARRFATYKRSTLLLEDRDRLAAMLRHPEQPVQLVFSGKSHPRDDGGKRLIQEIARLQHEEPFRGRIVFLEDYDIHVARRLVQGVDVWVNNPRRPEEACGTSGMKALLNGALNLSILDGWWAEAFDGRNGFAIDSPGPHSDQSVQDTRDGEALRSAITRDVAPLYYLRNGDGLPHHWIGRMKWAFMTLAARYSADRMVMDYATRAYLPAAGGTSCAFPS